MTQGDLQQLAVELTGWNAAVTGLIEWVLDTHQWGLFGWSPRTGMASGRLVRANAVQQASREAGHLYDSVVEEEYDRRDERIRRMAPFYAWLSSHDADSLVPPPLAPAR